MAIPRDLRASSTSAQRQPSPFLPMKLIMSPHAMPPFCGIPTRPEFLRSLLVQELVFPWMNGDPETSCMLPGPAHRVYTTSYIEEHAVASAASPLTFTSKWHFVSLYPPTGTPLFSFSPPPRSEPTAVDRYAPFSSPRPALTRTPHHSVISFLLFPFFLKIL